MSVQSSLLGVKRKPKQIRSKKFLSEMDRIVPWSSLCAKLAPHYKTGEGGRRAYDLKLMLKIHFLQQWYNLGDEMMEESIYSGLHLV